VRGRGCLIGLIGVLAGLGLIGGVADVGARDYTTSKIEQRIRQSVPDATNVKAEIHSFPLLKVGVDGHVDEIGASMGLTVGALDFTNIDVQLRGVRISVTDLFQGKVTVTRISSGTASLTVTDASLVNAVIQSFPTGGINPSNLAKVLGNLRFTYYITSRELVIKLPGLTALRFPLPDTNLVPCVPSVAVQGTNLTLSCEFSQVPKAFLTPSS